MNIVEWLRVIFLGMLEGITEWLPISSTAHLILMEAFWKTTAPEVFTTDFREMFDVVVQLGAITAVLTEFAYKLNPVAETKTGTQRRKTVELWKKVLLGCIPVGAAGFFLNDIINRYLSHWAVIAAMLILIGILFLVIEHIYAKGKPAIIKFSQLSYKSVFVIGLIQILALIPGTSRSGITIIAALSLGCSRFIATEFSFYMAIPVIGAASIYRVALYLIRGNTVTADQFFSMLFGSIVAFLVSKLVVRFFMQFIRRHTFNAFAVYRIVLGIVIIVCGVIKKLS